MTTAVFEKRIVEGDKIVVHPEIKTDLIDITPELAEQWLEKNRNIRSIRPLHVDTLVREMQADNWSADTFEYIKFNRFDELVDGQHRLSAVVKSGKTITNCVCWGITEQDVMKIDSGLQRTNGDVLNYFGVKHGKDVASAYRVIMALMTRPSLAMYRGGSKSPATDVYDFQEENPEIHDSVEFYYQYKSKLAGLIRPSQAIAIHFLITKKWGKDKADEFFTPLATGLGLTERNPIYVLRQRLINNQTAQNSKMVPEMVIFVTVKGFNKWLAGEEIHQIRIAMNESLPSI